MKRIFRKIRALGAALLVGCGQQESLRYSRKLDEEEEVSGS